MASLIFLELFASQLTAIENNENTLQDICIFYMDRKINVFECENVQTAFDSQRFFNLEIFRITKFICPIL